jgi:predicted nicotinamide N-methyase
VTLPPNIPAELHRRFTLATQDVSLPGGPVTLLKPRNADDLISEADYVRDERLPYWADLWPSSETLASFLLEQRLRLATVPAVAAAAADGVAPRAIELGCGLGLPTIAALRVGFDVLATDYYDDALPFAVFNAEHNVGLRPATRMVDWTAMPEDLGTFALVLAADVLYEMRYAPILADVVMKVLAPGGVFLLADQGRIALSSFLEEAAARGLDWHAALRVEPPVGVAKPSITIYELRWRTG